MVEYIYIQSTFIRAGLCGISIKVLIQNKFKRVLTWRP